MTINGKNLTAEKNRQARLAMAFFQLKIEFKMWLLIVWFYETEF